MPSQILHLPNGQTFTVTPVFGGLNFKSNEGHLQQAALPPGWTIVISTNRKSDDSSKDASADVDTRSTRFVRPTMNQDSFYISSIVNLPATEYKPVNSPTRQIAMMVWISLSWYFHEPEPELRLDTEATAKTPMEGRPKGDWRVYIKRDGIFKGRNLLQKLERMGLIACEESSVGYEPIETRDVSAWVNMFVSRRSFWQIDPRLFLFNLTPPNVLQSPQPWSNPPSGRSSPSRGDGLFRFGEGAGPAPGEGTFSTATGGPFISSSHLPTYYPPPPTQFTFTNGVRHPIRGKPPHQGEVFYVRYIPSVQQFLSFRVPFLPSRKSQDPVAPSAPSHAHSVSTSSIEQQFQNMPSDLDTVHRWMNDPRVNASWGEAGPPSHQEEFLRMNMRSRHSFPAIGCWDGKPFGYFEIYWVKEDKLGQLLGGVDDYDRGIHLLVGEQEYRGPHRVAIWLSALVHYCWLADMRTQTVMLEPRVDNEK